MLVTKFEDDKFKMLVTVLTILVTNIHYALSSDFIFQKMSPTSKFSDQHLEIVTIEHCCNNEFLRQPHWNSIFERQDMVSR